MENALPRRLSRFCATRIPLLVVTFAGVLWLLTRVELFGQSAAGSTPVLNRATVVISDFELAHKNPTFEFLKSAIPAFVQSRLISLPVHIVRSSKSPECPSAAPVVLSSQGYDRDYYLVSGRIDEQADSVSVTYELARVRNCNAEGLIRETKQFSSRDLTGALTAIAQAYGSRISEDVETKLKVEIKPLVAARSPEKFFLWASGETSDLAKDITGYLTLSLSLDDRFEVETWQGGNPSPNPILSGTVKREGAQVVATLTIERDHQTTNLEPVRGQRNRLAVFLDQVETAAAQGLLGASSVSTNRALDRKKAASLMQEAQRLQAEGKYPEALRKYAPLVTAKELPEFQGEALVATGKIYLKQKEYQACANNLEQALGVIPPTTEILNDLGTCYLNSRRPEIAREQLLRSLDLNPDQPAVQLEIGDTFRQQRDYLAATRQYLSSKAAPEVIENRISGLARDLRKDEVEPFVEILSDASRGTSGAWLKADEAVAWITLGKILESEGKFSEAANQYRQACQLSVDDRSVAIESRAQLALVLLRLASLSKLDPNALSEADHVLTEAEERFSNDVPIDLKEWVTRLQGLVLEQRHDYRGALAKFRHGYELLPSTMGDLQIAYAAVRELRDATAGVSNPDLLREAQKDLRDAQDRMTREIETSQEENVVQAYTLVNRELGNITQTRETLEKLLATDPQNYALLESLGTAYTYEPHNYEVACKYLKRAVKASPGNLSARENLVEVAIFAGDLETTEGQARDIVSRLKSAASSKGGDQKQSAAITAVMEFYLIVAGIAKHRSVERERSAWSEAIKSAYALGAHVADYWRFDEFEAYLSTTHDFDDAQKRLVRDMLKSMQGPSTPVQAWNVTDVIPNYFSRL